MKQVLLRLRLIRVKFERNFDADQYRIHDLVRGSGGLPSLKLQRRSCWQLKLPTIKYRRRRVAVGDFNDP